MNNLEPVKHEIDDLISEKPASSVPLEKPITPTSITVDFLLPSKLWWSTRSLELTDRYNYGTNLGKFGNTTKSIEMLYKRLGDGIIDIIKNECAKNNKSAEDLQLHFEILSSIMIMIGKAVVNKQLVTSSPDTIIAGLHGYIESYIEQVIKDK